MIGNQLLRIFQVGLVPLSFLALPALSAQLNLGSVPVGAQPLGVDVVTVTTSLAYVAVANSGGNSVSILSLNRAARAGSQPFVTIEPLTTVTGIPSPYAVVACAGTQVLVTSPSDNTVRVLNLPGGAIVGPLKVGSQPYSASCFYNPTTGKQAGVVSNLGDNTLVVFDLATLAITATIPGVPGSRGFHGVGTSQNTTSTASTAVAWVAGTDANVVTVVDLINSKVITQIPASQPTTVLSSGVGSGSQATMVVASAGSNTITVYNRDTLQIGETIQNVPDPQDFVGPELGIFATIGGQASIWWMNDAGTVSTIPGVPGAAALATTNFLYLPSAATAVVVATGTNSNSVFLLQPGPPPPSAFSMANAASFGIWPATGSLASVFAQTGAAQPVSATSLPLPTNLGGLSLSIGGTIGFDASSGFVYSSTGSIQAPLLFVGPTQVNFQMPPGISPGSAVPAQLAEPNGTTLLTTVQVSAVAPGIFTLLENGQGQGAVLNQDSSPNGNPAATVGAAPATRGTVIQIFATGAGATNPALGAGQPAPTSGALVLTVTQPTVAIGGVNAPVQFSGMAPGFVGLWQINAVVKVRAVCGNAARTGLCGGGQQWPSLPRLICVSCFS